MNYQKMRDAHMNYQLDQNKAFNYQRQLFSPLPSVDESRAVLHGGMMENGGSSWGKIGRK
jgi:hypothetical protein